MTDTADSTNSLLMMINTTQSVVRGSAPMYLAGAILGTGVHILVDIGATHNVIDINVARAIGLLEQRTHTTILLGSGNEVSCRAAAFSVPLCIDTESFQIGTFPFEIGNNIDVILGTPWLADLGCFTWDFSTTELHYFRNGRSIYFNAIRAAPAHPRGHPRPPSTTGHH